MMIAKNTQDVTAYIKCNGPDDILNAIYSCADRASDYRGNWEAVVTLDVTDCFDEGDIISLDSGNHLLLNPDALPTRGEITVGGNSGTYKIVDLSIKGGRAIAVYFTERNTGWLPAYQMGAKP